LNFTDMPEQPTIARSAVPRQRRMEIYAFLIVTAVLMPALAVATVGSWGLTVWIYQVINGPPGPPSK
jgi:periplasmic nitrate reductase NapE